LRGYSAEIAPSSALKSARRGAGVDKIPRPNDGVSALVKHYASILGGAEMRSGRRDTTGGSAWIFSIFWYKIRGKLLCKFPSKNRKRVIYRIQPKTESVWKI